MQSNATKGRPVKVFWVFVLLMLGENTKRHVIV
jgi:hypothetical protein